MFQGFPVLYEMFFSEAHFPTLMEIFVESKLGTFAICNLQFSEEEKCACSNPSESEVSTNMCESSTTSYLLRWLEIVFFGAREDLAQIVLHFENL